MPTQPSMFIREDHVIAQRILEPSVPQISGFREDDLPRVDSSARGTHFHSWDIRSSTEVVEGKEQTDSWQDSRASCRDHRNGLLCLVCSSYLRLGNSDRERSRAADFHLFYACDPRRRMERDHRGGRDGNPRELVASRDRRIRPTYRLRVLTGRYRSSLGPSSELPTPS